MLLDHFRFASEMPVMFLPGRAKLSAKPPPDGRRQRTPPPEGWFLA
jgi:hypothetical protein